MCLRPVRSMSERGSCPAGTPSDEHPQRLASCDLSGWGSRRPWSLLWTCNREAGKSVAQACSCYLELNKKIKLKKLWVETWYSATHTPTTNRETKGKWQKFYSKVQQWHRGKHNPPLREYRKMEIICRWGTGEWDCLVRKHFLLPSFFPLMRVMIILCAPW